MNDLHQRQAMFYRFGTRFKIGPMVLNALVAQPVDVGFDGGEILFQERNRDVFKKLSIPFLTLAQRLLRLLARGDVLGNLDNTGDFAVGFFAGSRVSATIFHPAK
jgi:hypothetical protein